MNTKHMQALKVVFNVSFVTQTNDAEKHTVIFPYSFSSQFLAMSIVHRAWFKNRNNFRDRVVSFGPTASGLLVRQIKVCAAL